MDPQKPSSTTSNFELRTSNSSPPDARRLTPDSCFNFLQEAFSRNIGLFTPAEQQTLFSSTVAIPGMGGVGGAHLITLTRTGIGKFNIADFDVFEPANINRQAGAAVPNFGRKKLAVMKEQALSINPYLNITEFPDGINEHNIDAFLEGVQVVVDGLDFFSFDIRRMLFNKAKEHGAHVVTAGPMGYSAALLVFAPHEGMTFDEYFAVTKDMPEEDRHLHFALGLSPRPTHIKYMDLTRVDLKSKAGPSLAIACQIAAGMAATETVRILLKKGKIRPVPHFFQFDPFLRKYRKGKLYFGNKNPIQLAKLRVVKHILEKKKNPFSVTAPELPKTAVSEDAVPQDVMEYILQAGIRAPSGDNCQPWKFSVDGNTIHLFLNRDADRSFFNVRQIASIISCGAVVENMKIAATRFGLKADVKLLSDPENPDAMARIHFTSDPAIKQDPLADAIWKRCTNRKMYKKRPLPEETLQALQEAVSGFDGVRLHLITDRKKLKKLAWLIYKTDRIRTEHRGLHEHLHRMIRWTKEEALEKRDGFYIKNLEAGLAGELFLKMTRPWWIMSIMNKTGMGRMVALHSYQGILNSPAAGLITADGMTTEDFLKGGQALERLWLFATQMGLAFQPMTAITLFWLRWILEGEKSFTIKHRRLLNRVWQDYLAIFTDDFFKKQSQVMLFRVGYAKVVHYTTLRKLDHFDEGI